jgi:hypothetical protein
MIATTDHPARNRGNMATSGREVDDASPAIITRYDVLAIREALIATG